VAGNVQEKVTMNRNKALEELLESIVIVDVPDSLILEETRVRFAQMMADFKKQGNTDEEVKKMVTQENFLKVRRETRGRTC
jgi:FKBP-type peptidyl-prolyl cis-trans isomerase (trigger factor)